MAVSVVDLNDAWTMLAEDSSAVLLDVRTEAEWTFVGIPDLRTLNKQPVFIEWIRFPSNDVNADFHQQATKSLDPTANTLVLCRSGVRSQAAAAALEQIGFVAAFNVVAGFEGHLDPHGHRSGGWKTSGLPWIQH